MKDHYNRLKYNVNRLHANVIREEIYQRIIKEEKIEDSENVNSQKKHDYLALINKLDEVDYSLRLTVCLIREVNAVKL